MDLKTIHWKIKSHTYNNLTEFDRDVRLIIANSYVFNSRETVYYNLTKEFQTLYEELWNEYERDPGRFGRWF